MQYKTFHDVASEDLFFMVLCDNDQNIIKNDKISLDTSPSGVILHSLWSKQPGSEASMSNKLPSRVLYVPKRARSDKLHKLKDIL